MVSKREKHVDIIKRMFKSQKTLKLFFSLIAFSSSPVALGPRDVSLSHEEHLDLLGMRRNVE